MVFDSKYQVLFKFRIQNMNSAIHILLLPPVMPEYYSKYQVLFKFRIQNMNSARALQLSGSGTQIHLLFGALCRALLEIMQIIWFLIMQYGCAMLFNDNDLRGWWI